MVRCKTFSTAEVAPMAQLPEEAGTLAKESPSKKQIFHTYEEALAFALPYAVERLDKAGEPAIAGGLDILPEEVNGPWNMSKKTIEYSLKHIYMQLYHTCYMMCVKGGVAILKKLEPSGIPTFYSDAIEAKEKENPDMFRVLQGKEPRVMQCVIKARSDKESVSKEYMDFIHSFPIKLPNGVFILNLTDAVIYRKDGKLPWEAMSAPLRIEDTPLFLPVLGGSGAKGYWDIPMPNYDDLGLATSRKGLPSYEIDWTKKKNIAVFRGGPTGCGTNAVTNMRIKLAGMRRADLDVGLVREKSSNPRYNYKRGGIFTMDLAGVKAVPFMSMEDQSKHKYVIHIDGNVAAYRLLNTMLMGSVVLKVEGPYTLWVDHLIRDKVHFISVKEDLSNLDEVMEWCKGNDEECKRIGEAGREFALKALNLKYIQESFAKLCWGLIDKSMPTASVSSEASPITPRSPVVPISTAQKLVAAAASKFKGFKRADEEVKPTPAVAPPAPAVAVAKKEEAPAEAKAMSASERLKLLKEKLAGQKAAKKGGRRTRRYIGYRRRITRKV